MSAEFWKDAFEILLAIDVAVFGILYALYLKSIGVGEDEPDPEWEYEVEYADE